MKASDHREFANQHKSLKGDIERIQGGALGSPGRVDDRTALSELKRAIGALRTKLRDHFAFEEEEDGGYLQQVLNSRPALKRKVDKLLSDHASILRALEHLEVAPADNQSPDSLKSGFVEAVRHLRRHEAAEMDLLSQAINDDLGVGD